MMDLTKTVLGIELGCELMALATGSSVERMSHSHRGSNYPVKFIDKNIVYITSQNHGYAVASVNDSVAEVTHRNINDATVEGLGYKGRKIITVQFCPGGETSFIYDEFIDMMGGN